MAGFINIPNVFSAGAVIVASQHNSNFTTIVNAINGGLDNTNLTGTAGITYANLSIAGSIVNADIAGAAGIVGSKLDLSTPGNIGATSPGTGKFTTLEATTTLKLATTHQGDVLYDNGTSLVRLTPGTSGQVLTTAGAAANPSWTTVSSISNCLFQYSAVVSNIGTGIGEIIGTSLVPSTGGTYRFLQNKSAQNTYKTLWATKWKKISGVSTVTIYGQIWVSGSTDQANLKVDIGGQNNNVSGTANQSTPEWNNFTIDVSGLTNGTVYDVTVSTAQVANVGSNPCYLGNLIAFGS